MKNSDFDLQISRRITDYIVSGIRENPEFIDDLFNKYKNIIQDTFFNITSKFIERKKESDVTMLIHDFNYSKLMENVTPNEYIQIISCLYHAFIIFTSRFHDDYYFCFVNEDREKNQFQILLGPSEDLNIYIWRR